MHLRSVYRKELGGGGGLEIYKILTSHSTGTVGSFSGEKRQGSAAVRSTPPSFEFQNEWSYTSSPPVSLDGVDRNKFAFSFLDFISCEAVE